MCQVCAEDTLTLEQKQNLIIKNLQTDNFNMLLVLLSSVLIFIIYIIYLLLSKTLYFGKILRQASKNKRILLFILTTSGYKLKEGRIHSEMIQETVKYYVEYKEDDKIIRFPLFKEHIIRPETDMKNLPFCMLISNKYSIDTKELQTVKLINDINTSIENKESLMKALKKHSLNDEEITALENRLYLIQEKLNNYKKRKLRGIVRLFKKQKTITIDEIYWILRELEEIKDIYKNAITNLLEESKYRNEVSMKDILLNMYSDTPIRMDFAKFTLLINQFGAIFDLMNKAIPKTTTNNKVLIIVGILVILIIIGGFFMVSGNIKLPV